MSTPIPTPYDIISPPSVPFSPSLLVWLTLLFFCLAIVLIVLKLKRLTQRETIPPESPESKVLLVIESLKNKQLESSSASLLTRTVRRYIALAETSDATAMTPEELKQLSIQSDNIELMNLVSDLVTLENIAYQDKESYDQELLFNIEESFRRYAKKRGTS